MGLWQKPHEINYYLKGGKRNEAQKRRRDIINIKFVNSVLLTLLFHAESKCIAFTERFSVLIFFFTESYASLSPYGFPAIEHTEKLRVFPRVHVNIKKVCQSFIIIFANKHVYFPYVYLQPTHGTEQI